MRARPISGYRALKGLRHEQVPPLRAVARAIVEQPARPRQPPGTAGELAAIQQYEDQPTRASRGPQYVALAQERAMRTLPRLHAVLITANEVRRRGEPLEVLRLERRLAIRRGQLGERIRPRPPTEALPAARECLGRRHAPAPDDSPGTRASRGAPSKASVSPDTRASYARRVAARFDAARHSRAPPAPTDLPQSNPDAALAKASLHR
jgi:hypothetical protein